MSKFKKNNSQGQLGMIGQGKAIVSELLHSIKPGQSKKEKMSETIKSMEYTVERCQFHIQLTKTSINIAIEDYQNKLRCKAEITNQLLPSPSDINILYQDMFKQYLYENKQAKRMLRIEGKCILILFDYPKCEAQPLSIPCHIQSTDEIELMLQKVQALVGEKITLMEQIASKCIARISQASDQHMLKFTQIIDEKFEQISSKLDAESTKKAQEFYDFYNESQREHSQALRQELESSVRRVMEDNGKIAKQFNVARQRLEESIRALNLNINTIEEQIDDIQNALSEERAKTEAQNTSVYLTIEQKTSRLMEKIEQLGEKFEKEIHRLDPERSLSQEMLKGAELAKLQPEHTKYVGEDSEGCEHS